jgi:2-isopropylmalate synthase
MIAALRDSGAPVVTLVAKSHDRHVELALRTTLEENLAMVRDTVAHLTAEGQTVFLDAEHFFDGYRANPPTRSRCSAGGVRRRAPRSLVLCDTNGGMLPH